MSRNVTAAFIAACNAQQTDEAFIMLVTIDHDDLAEPIRLNDSGENQVSNGETYLASPIQVTLAEDSADRLPQVKIVMDNIDRTIVAVIRGITTPPTVDLAVVKASDLDTVEASFTGFTLREVNYNALVIEGTLTLEGIEGEPACAWGFTPSYFPGLF